MMGKVANYYGGTQAKSMWGPQNYGQPLASWGGGPSGMVALPKFDPNNVKTWDQLSPQQQLNMNHQWDAFGNTSDPNWLKWHEQYDSPYGQLWRPNMDAINPALDAKQDYWKNRPTGWVNQTHPNGTPYRVWFPPARPIPQYWGYRPLGWGIL